MPDQAEALIRLSQIINCMEAAGKIEHSDRRLTILAQYREEASYHLRVLEETCDESSQSNPSSC